jgi:GntR family transcriptional regulator
LSFRLNVDPRSGYPIYLQIVAQIERAIALGLLRPGEQLPTVKQLASELLVNPSTISRAMRELEYHRVIVSYAGRGSFVAENATVSVATNAATSTVATSLGAALREARELGVDAETARELVERTLASVYGEQKAVNS